MSTFHPGLQRPGETDTPWPSHILGVKMPPAPPCYRPATNDERTAMVKAKAELATALEQGGASGWGDLPPPRTTC